MKRPGLTRSLLALGAGAFIILLALGFFLWRQQTRIIALTTDARDRLFQTVLERQRVAINVERLGRFGEIVLTTHDSRRRRSARLAAQVLAQDSAFESGQDLHGGIMTAFEAIRKVAAIRDLPDGFAPENEARCLAAWDQALAVLAELTDRLSTDAATAAARRFDAIVDNARKVMAIFWICLGGIAAMAGLVVYCIRRDLARPILRTVQELERARTTLAPVSVPRARLKELDDIGQAVQRLSQVLADEAERTEELGRSNRALTGEIAERRRAEAALAAAKLAAEAATRAKSEFLAGMSHEIRTPMNVILGMADLMAETPLTPDQQRFVDVFRSAGEHLLGIINDILDISKIEAGQTRLERTPLDPAALVREAAALMEPGADKKGLRLITDIRPGLPPLILGDPVRLRQILGNLLANAVKFTESGHVALVAGPGDGDLPGSGSGGRLDILVRDTGIGIPEDMHEAIFERFTQADTSTTRRYGGTGLGLAIVRMLVQIMGGTIRVESSPGQGAAFHLSLPLELPQGEKAA